MIVLISQSFQFTQVCRHHRQTIMSHVDTLPELELPFLDRMFSKDAKNYHVWSYRQWLVRHFSLWDSEIPFVEALLDADVRNNSAWNHRWFVVFGRYLDPSKHSISNSNSYSALSETILGNEIEYTQGKIALAPQNQSPWNYLRGIVRHRADHLATLKTFAEKFANVEDEDQIQSSHALDFLADIYTGERRHDKSGRALELLASKYDPIRKNYWEYRKTLLQPA